MSFSSGWFSDPYNTHQLRYWDGSRWTEHTRTVQPPELQTQVTADTTPGWHTDLTNEAQERYWDGQVWGSMRPKDFIGSLQPRGKISVDRYFAFVKYTKLAKNMVIVQAGAMSAFWILFAGIVYVISSWATTFSTSSYSYKYSTKMPPIPGILWFLLISALLFIIIYVIAYIIFIIWFYKSAEVSAKLGIPAKFSPGLAVGGWFIPYANYVMPLLAALDFTPKGYSARKTVIKWWVFYLCAMFIPSILYLATFAIGASILSVIIVVAQVLTATFGYKMISEVTSFQMKGIKEHNLLGQ